jgi:hypothetical protein
LKFYEGSKPCKTVECPCFSILIPEELPGRPRKLNETHVQFIQDRLEAKNDITLGELCAELQQQLEITVSEPTLCRVMQRLSITHKKKALHPSDKGSDRVQQLRTQNWETHRDVRVQDLVFIDESGVNLGLMRLFAWALRGRRARGEKAKRGKNASLIAGLSLKGVVGTQGFAVVPRRWVVERTFGWFGRYRRLSKDYEYLPTTNEPMLYIAMINITLRRLAYSSVASQPLD